jgi:hypothetical protein
MQDAKQGNKDASAVVHVDSTCRVYAVYDHTKNEIAFGYYPKGKAVIKIQATLPLTYDSSAKIKVVVLKKLESVVRELKKQGLLTTKVSGTIAGTKKYIMMYLKTPVRVVRDCIESTEEYSVLFGAINGEMLRKFNKWRETAPVGSKFQEGNLSAECKDKFSSLTLPMAEIENYVKYLKDTNACSTFLIYKDTNWDIQLAYNGRVQYICSTKKNVNPNGCVAKVVHVRSELYTVQQSNHLDIPKAIQTKMIDTYRMLKVKKLIMEEH